jgi:hypothetical protein
MFRVPWRREKEPPRVSANGTAPLEYRSREDDEKERKERAELDADERFFSPRANLKALKRGLGEFLVELIGQIVLYGLAIGGVIVWFKACR